MTKSEFSSIFSGRISEKSIESLWKRDFVASYKKSTVSVFRKSFVCAFLEKNPKTPQIVGYVCKALHTDKPVWKDFTRVHLNMIGEYFNSNLAPNSAATYAHVLQALLNDYSEEGIIPAKRIKGVMKVKSVPSQHVALTMEELDAFDRYVPQNDIERDVKCIFMRAAYTGARCSDAKALTLDNIHDGTLSYVSEKTKIESFLPVHKNLRKYLAYTPTADYRSKTVERIVRRICKSIGMTQKVSLFVNGEQKTGEKWEFVTMHSARRTFCTLLAKIGVPLSEIRAMAGHTSELMTSRYVCLSGANPGADAMRFFQH